jgi:hypothetical protein
MNKNKKPRNKSRKRSNNALFQNIPTNRISYNGPLATTVDSTVSTFYLDSTISASASGIVSAVLDNDPSSAQNWVSYTACWNEYRVLGIRYKYVPGNVVNTATIAGFTGYHCIIRGMTAPTITSLSEAASTGISRPWTAFRPWSRDWKMSDVDEATFISTSFPTTTSRTLAIYATGGTASTTYGHLSTQYLVQFRGHTL